jgi:hypothetical protein
MRSFCSNQGGFVPFHLARMRTRRDASRFVEVVPGVIAAAEFTCVATFIEPEAPEVTLHMRTADDGVISCERLEIAPPAGERITAVTLRAIPIGFLLKEAAVNGSAPGTIDAPDGSKYTLPGGEPTEEQEPEIEAKAGGRPRGYPIDDDELRRVADTYRAAIKLGEHPTQRVMREHHTGRSTASRWIRRARDAGHLGAARPRVAGEYDAEDS